MQPTPFTTALPKLAAIIDDERPLISAALLDILVTDIGDAIVRAEVTTEHNFEILTMPSQHEYLNKALSRHWGKEAAFSLTLKVPSEIPQTIANDSQPPQTSPKRTANTLTFTERAALQHWMSQPENRAFVANESDADAARQATQDLSLMVSAVAGSESDCKPSFPDLIITPGNIASMRKILGIEKVKPTKTAPLPVHDIDLVALHAKVQEHGLLLDPLKDNDLPTILSNLRNSLVELENRVKSLEASAD
jgi:hypothetical protein